MKLFLLTAAVAFLAGASASDSTLRGSSADVDAVAEFYATMNSAVYAPPAAEGDIKTLWDELAVSFACDISCLLDIRSIFCSLLYRYRYISFAHSTCSLSCSLYSTRSYRPKQGSCRSAFSKDAPASNASPRAARPTA